MINLDGYRPLESKADAVQKFPRPMNVFSASLDVIIKTLRNVAAILDPLYELLSPHKNSIREAQTELITDGSNTAIGATIQQVVDGVARLLAFFF